MSEKESARPGLSLLFFLALLVGTLGISVWTGGAGAEETGTWSGALDTNRTPSPLPSPTPTATSSPIPPTETPTPTSTPTLSPTPTPPAFHLPVVIKSAPTPTMTSTPEVPPTYPTGTLTTPSPTETPTETSSPTPTDTPETSPPTPTSTLTQTPSPTPTDTPESPPSTWTELPFPTSTDTPAPPTNTPTATPTEPCGEIIENGNFEQGHAAWTEESSQGYEIISSAWPDPFQGSWVAWFGYVNNNDERIYQLVHVPLGALDNQTLDFYLYVQSDDDPDDPYDMFYLRFFDAAFEPISDPIWIADNTTPMDWTYYPIGLSNFSSVAGQDIYIQFRGTTDWLDPTNFVIDLVSLDIVCGAEAAPPSGPPHISVTE